MKKSRYIALALSACIMLTGTGYAYWKDNVNINSQVSIGNFQVKFEKSCIYDNTSKDPYVKVDTTLVNDHTLKFDISNIYPGAGGGFSYKITNTGSIPAKFDSATISNLVDSDKLDANKILTYSIYAEKVDGLGIPSLPHFSMSTANSTADLAGKFNQLLLNWDGPNKPLILKPSECIIFFKTDGQSVVPGYFVSLNDNETGYENSHLSFNLSFNFKQWNAK